MDRTKVFARYVFIKNKLSDYINYVLLTSYPTEEHLETEDVRWETLLVCNLSWRDLLP